MYWWNYQFFKLRIIEQHAVVSVDVRTNKLKRKPNSKIWTCLFFIQLWSIFLGLQNALLYKLFTSQYSKRAIFFYGKDAKWGPNSVFESSISTIYIFFLSNFDMIFDACFLWIDCLRASDIISSDLFWSFMVLS